MDRLTLSTRAACALFTLLLVAPSPGLASEPPSYDAALDAIAAYAPRAMREQGTPGLSIAITDSTRTLRDNYVRIRRQQRADAGDGTDALRNRIDH